MGKSKSPIPLFSMFIYTWQRPFALPECVSNLYSKPLTCVHTHGEQRYGTYDVTGPDQETIAL